MLSLLKKDTTSKKEKLSFYLPWVILIDKGVVLNKNGSLQQTIEFRGQDLMSATESEQEVCMAQVNDTQKRLGDGWTIYVEQQNRISSVYPHAEFQTEPARIIDGEKQRKFLLEGEHYEKTNYMTLVYLPPSTMENSLKNLFFENIEPIDHEADIDFFKKEVMRVVGALQSTFVYVHYLNDDETMTYLHSTISTNNHKVKAPHIPVYLDYILPDQPVTGGIEPMIGEYHLGIVSLNGYFSNISPNVFRELSHMDGEYRWVSRFKCLSREKAIKEYKTYGDSWFQKRESFWGKISEMFTDEKTDKIDQHSVNRAAECEEAIELIKEGVVSGGHYTNVVIVWDKDKNRLDNKIYEITTALNNTGCVAIVEKYNALRAFLGSLPGNSDWNRRQVLLHSFDFTNMIPTTAEYNGQIWNPEKQMQAFFVAKTSSKVPFYFHPFVSDVGHMTIIGPTGYGKSVLLNLIVNTFQKFKGATVYFFDKDYSAYVTTMLNGGVHYDLGQNEKIAFQPLKNIDEQSNRLWAEEWIIDNVLFPANVTIDPTVRKALHEALELLSLRDTDQRTFSALRTLVQNNHIKEALNTMTLSGSLGYLFDAQMDGLNTESKFHCFELGHMIEYIPSAVKPTLTYLFHHIEQQLTGDPTVLVLDEGWIWLDDELFEKKLKSWLKTLRKKNAFVVFATQSLSDVDESKIFYSVVESCPTKIYLPNEKAFNKTIRKGYENAGLNDKQIDIIAKARRKKEYYLTSDLGNRLIDLDLGAKELAIVGSSSKKDIAKVKELSSQTCNQGELISKFFQYKGIES